MTLSLKRINELDLTTPEGQNELAGLAEGSFSQAHPYIMSLAKTWDTNIRFYEGDQWIYYDETLRQNVQIPVIEGKTDFIPRPVTNYIPSILWTLASIFTKNKPTALIFPNSDDAQDVMAAKVAEALADAKWEMDDENRKHVEAILIALLCGTVFRKDYWDPSKYDTFVESGLGGQQKVPLGDTSVDMLSPFEVFPDIYGNQYYIQASVTPINDIKMMYGREGDGYTGLVDKVKPSKQYSGVLQLRENLRTHTRNYNGSVSTANDNNSETILLVESYIKPTPRYPHGLMLVESGGTPLYCNHSPYYNPKLEDSWHPYTSYRWMITPLRWHAMSLVEQLVPLQRRINGIDSIVQLHNMSMINPVWMNPKSCQVPTGYYNGRPGLVIDYTDGPNSTPPQRVNGSQLGNDIYEERKQKMEDMHAIAGDNLVMQGNQPSGVNTASGLQLLLEQSATKFSPFYTNWEKFIEGGQQKKLLLISKFYTQNRPDFVERMKKYSKNSNDVELQSFVGADLRDNTNVRIEAGSSIPRSKIVEQQQLLDLAKMGVLGDITPANPVANAEFLRKFGIPQFDGVTNPDIVKANYVVAVLNQINENKLNEQNYPPFMPFENVDIHMSTLVDEMKKPDFKDTKGVFQAKFNELNAVKEAQMQAQAQMMQDAQMQQMAMQNFSGANPESSAGAPPGSLPPGGEPPLQPPAPGPLPIDQGY